MSRLIPVIMSGGAGTRLWPVSRQAHPKPFMELPDGDTLLQKSMSRVAALADVDEVMTLTNRELYFETSDRYKAIGFKQPPTFSYVLEPIGRNTAPAIAAAAMRLHAADPEAVMLVVTADHLIQREDRFAGAVRVARQLAEQGMLVTFGITPTHPETGFGYIERGAALSVAGDVDAQGAKPWQVARFVEKPDQATAEGYLASGNFLWNSGMFCFRPEVFLNALQQHAPGVFDAVQRAIGASEQVTPFVLDNDTFAVVPSISVDYAVMEKADNVAVVECDIDWSDIGAWDSFSQLIEPDEHGNRQLGEVLMIDSEGCFVDSQDRLVATVGTRDLIVVDTADALLIADRRRDQDVKKVVDVLKQQGHEAYMLHRTVHRPWGTYTVLEEDDRFKIKRIMVKPGRTLSLQMHHHRSEHWIVVSGTAKVVNGEEEFLVMTNESTFIPAGTQHRLGNPGVLDLAMIEVQSGEYLGEDDIVRFEDIYGRS
ncbi:MAG: mannose-1-phosphate guanylyltransferase/mannose-6-phosphate isomerase [Gammaproteobacteria bacterium]|nr:mannose-1-phosphate guanylyltransferase/mannose-6-phosphate isomerase [Gammaproteobacteria bacterium]MCP5137350.1 mannose-1-phosphate guanylyltransferase/mannose-6-phosphate isomerase [Gammaproteobacteria bacterium]